MKHDVPAVILLSGGLDSATVLAMAVHQNYRAFCLTVQYGQRHAAEIQSARAVATRFGAHKHEIIELDLRKFGGSALTDDIAVPKDMPPNDVGHAIPVTYVPARNTIFLSLALAWAETIGSHDIFIGVNALDYSGYPDCRPEFIRAYEELARLATRAGVEDENPMRIHAPLIAMTKADIIRRGHELGVDFGLTSSCYDPDQNGRACGQCDACGLRRQGFEAANLSDPTIYQTTSP